MTLEIEFSPSLLLTDDNPSRLYFAFVDCEKRSLFWCC